MLENLEATSGARDDEARELLASLEDSLSELEAARRSVGLAPRGEGLAEQLREEASGGDMDLGGALRMLGDMETQMREIETALDAMDS